MRKLILAALIAVLFLFASGPAPAQNVGDIPGRNDSVGNVGGDFKTPPDIAVNHPEMAGIPDPYDEAAQRWFRQRTAPALRPGLAPGQSGSTGKSATAPVP